MLFGKKKKARQELDGLWRSMEMACENNYKDMAHESLKDFEENLERYYADGAIPQEEYRSRSRKLEEKKTELKGYGHNQHIGW
ncbi:MAG: hypothetical protein OSJ45_03440 [Lachnospiraceae bacterium]|nr:hypothetical protein [Lachnospiraceae bacterium]